MRVTKVFSGLLALASIVAIAGLGCGTAQEEYSVVEHPQCEASSAWSVPEPVVEQLSGCLKEHANDLRTHAHETKFELRVTERGDVQKVELRNSTLHHEAIESCMMKALAELSIPSSVVPLRSSEPFSGGEQMRQERGPLGIVQALGGAIAVGPIILVAAGVTLAVAVIVVATDEAIEAAKRRRKIDLACEPPFAECLANQWQPEWNIGDYGPKKDCLVCLWRCRNEAGLWPDRMCPRPNYRPN